MGLKISRSSVSSSATARCGTFEDIGDLLAFVKVLRHDGALSEKDLRHHGLVAGNDLARDGRAQDLFWHVVPRVVFHIWWLLSPTLRGSPRCNTGCVYDVRGMSEAATAVKSP